MTDTVVGLYYCRGRMDRHVMLDNIELVLLTFDEVVDGG